MRRAAENHRRIMSSDTSVRGHVNTPLSGSAQWLVTSPRSCVSYCAKRTAIQRTGWERSQPWTLCKMMKEIYTAGFPSLFTSALHAQCAVSWFHNSTQRKARFGFRTRGAQRLARGGLGVPFRPDFRSSPNVFVGFHSSLSPLPMNAGLDTSMLISNQWRLTEDEGMALKTHWIL